MSETLHLATRSLNAPMLFSALPDKLQRELERGAPPRAFANEQIIQQRGDSGDGFWVIIEGSVAVGQYLADGEFRAMAVLGPGDSWGELAMFAGRPRVVDAVCRSACSLRHIRQSAFGKILNDHPIAMRRLLGALSIQLQEILDVTAGIRSGSANARVAGLLATLASREGQSALIEISQKELGELLGLSRMTVNMALKAYEQRALIRRHYGKIEVLQRDELQLLSFA